MKRIYSLFAGLAFALVSLTASATVSCDTISNLTSRDTLTLYLAPGNTGLLSGNNGYGDLEKAEQFTGPLGGTLGGAFIGFGYANILPADSSTTVTINAYSATAGAPGATIATTTVTLRQIAAAITAQTELYVTFTSPPTLASQTFFISVVLPTTGDTIAVLTNQISGALDGQGWERWSDNSWNAYAPTYGTFPYSFGNDIQAVTCGGAPLAALQSSLLNNCSSTATVDFYNTSSNGTDSVHWIFTGGTPATSNSNAPVVNYSATGNYNVTLIAYGTVANDTIHTVVHVYPPVTSTVTVTPASSGSAADGGATVTALTGTQPYQYFWNDPNQDTTRTVSGLTRGTYIVEILSADGCFTLDTVFIWNAAGITTINGNNGVQMFPIPANDVLNIKWDAATTADLTITDVSGKVLATYSVVNSTSQMLDIRTLAPGTYILNIRNTAGHAAQSGRFTKL